jgi:hypothetical protein
VPSAILSGGLIEQCPIVVFDPDDLKEVVQVFGAERRC